MPPSPNSSEFSPFVPGCAVLITLHNPREKFWGALLELSGSGIVVRGIDLNSFDDFAALAKAGEPLSTATVFFPLLRVEKVELDAENGSIPSLAEQFSEKAGIPAEEIFGFAGPSGWRESE